MEHEPQAIEFDCEFERRYLEMLEFNRQIGEIQAKVAALAPPKPFLLHADGTIEEYKLVTPSPPTAR